MAAFYDQVDNNHDHLLFKSLKSEVEVKKEDNGEAYVIDKKIVNES